MVCYDRAIALALSQLRRLSRANRGFVLRDLKRLDEAAASYARALSLRPAYEFLPGYYLQSRMMACDWDGG